jgi:hypothetical protein
LMILSKTKIILIIIKNKVFFTGRFAGFVCIIYLCFLLFDIIRFINDSGVLRNGFEDEFEKFPSKVYVCS